MLGVGAVHHESEASRKPSSRRKPASEYGASESARNELSGWLDSLESRTKSTDSRMARWLNRRHRGLCAVFADRPYAELLAASRAPHVVAYVHNNPVRARLVTWAGDTSWSSHRAYLGLEPRSHVPPLLAAVGGWRLPPIGRGQVFEIARARVHVKLWWQLRLRKASQGHGRLRKGTVGFPAIRDLMAALSVSNGGSTSPRVIAYRASLSDIASCRLNEARGQLQSPLPRSPSRISRVDAEGYCSQFRAR